MVRTSKGIKVNSSNFLYGGYAFSASYSVGFNNPSRCSISFLSESGEYDEGALKKRIGGNGAKKYDIINIGEWGPLKMHPLGYTIEEQPSGNVLQITYYDRSINFLDKYFVLLDKRNVPTGGKNGMNEKLRKKLDADKHIIIVGKEFIKSPAQKSVQNKGDDEQSATIRGEMLYTAGELAEEIKEKGSIKNKLPGSQLKLLESFGIIDRTEVDEEGESIADESKRTGYKGQGYLYGYNGSLRTVLNAWGQKLGFTFYWHPTKDKIYLMDLRGGVPYKDMNRCIDTILKGGKNIVSRNYSYSIEDTFSQGASAYFGKDGEEDGKEVDDMKFLLDVLNYPSYLCLTDPYRVVDNANPPPGSENEVYYDYKYIPQTESLGQGIKDRRHWQPYLPDRGVGVKYLDYIRLIKAAALGADFFATYVLMKKIANEPFQEGTEDFASPIIGSRNAGPTKVDLKTNSVALDNEGDSIEGSLRYPVVSNPEVDTFFHSSGDGVKIPGKKGNGQKLNAQDPSGDWIYGDDCLTARLLNPALTISSMIKSDLNVRAAVQGVLDSVFFGDTAKPDFWYFGSLAGKEFDFGHGPLEGAHNYPILNRLYLARVSDYALSGLLEDPGSSHQFQIFSAMAKFAGRFYVGRGTISQRDFKRRNYVEDNPTAIYRNTDVKDTPLGELYEALEIVHGAAAKEMPNPLITELLMHTESLCSTEECCDKAEKRKVWGVPKNRDSLEANYRVITGSKDKKDPCDIYKGERFVDPANTARPTIEQFICSIYTNTMDIAFDGEQAQFADSVPAAVVGEDLYEIGVDTVYPSFGGNGYVVGQPSPLTFTAVVMRNGKRVELTPIRDPVPSINYANTEIESVDFRDKGLWKCEDGVPVIEIKADEGGGAKITTNIFADIPKEVAEEDSIRKVNIDERNSTKIEQCCPIDLDPCVLLFDEGDQLVIPDLLKPHIERIGKFGRSPIDITASNLATYLKDSHIVLLPYLYKMDELEEKYGVLEGTEGAFDELDWIVDQVQIGGTYMNDAGGAEAANPDFRMLKLIEQKKKVRNVFCGPKKLTYLVRGDKFEYCHIVRPDDKKNPGSWRANVREDQFGSPKGQFLTPTLEDLGISPEECCPGDDEAKKKCKKEREEEIIEALKKLCDENSFDQDEPRNGLTVTLAGSAVMGENGKALVVSTDKEVIVPGYPSIPEGLEKLEVQIDGGGETSSLTLSAKRKMRIFKSAANISLYLPLGPRVENKLIGE